MSSGYIIDTPSVFSETAGWPALQASIESLGVTLLLVLGSNDKLHDRLASRYPQPNTVSIIRLPSSGGAVKKSASFIKAYQSARIREYFYGIPTESGRSDLGPHRTTVPFGKLSVRRIGDGLWARYCLIRRSHCCA